MAVTVVSWNIAKRHEPWRQLLQMDADVALLQEALPPPDDLVRLRDATLPPADAEGTGPLDIGPREAWDSHSWNSDWWHGRADALYDRWPMVVRLSDRVDIEWFKQVGPIGWAEQNEIAVSGIGTIAVARITPRDGSIEPFIAVSMYGRWEAPHPSRSRSSWIYSDGSTHRIISDLSAFISSTDPSTHRILAAGDLNMIYAATDDNRLEIPARARTITDRLDALGMEFLGPRYPAGRRACPSPQGACPRTPGMCPPTTPRRSPQRPHRTSWTTCSPHAASTRA